jgi:hypothetical protein
MRTTPRIAAALTALFLISASANAALLSRAGGQAYYDTDLNVTWLANANLGAGSIYDDGASATDGRMTWASAQSWIGSLNTANYLGVNNWQTPEANAACTGYSCPSSDLYHLFYGEGINDAAPSPFSNVGGGYYWSDDALSTLGSAYVFNLDDVFGGQQGQFAKNTSTFAWVLAMSDGDSLATVPLPAAVWLFGGALGALSVIKRRPKQAA